jgi:TonB family protein
MKQPSGPAPRRPAKPRKKIRLDLKRRPEPPPEEQIGLRSKSSFWKWVLLVAILHILVIGIITLIYQWTPAPKPPEQFIDLLPPGSVVKGTPGTQQAHKVGPTTAAAHHASATPPAPVRPPPPTAGPPPPTSQAVQPPKPLHLKPIIKPDAPLIAEDKPKPAKPKPPKVKVDLNLVDAPTTAADKPVTKPKTHPKKPVEKPAHDETDNPDSTGLSRDEIAKQLGEKLEAAGIKNGVYSGPSGSANSHASAFADFYASIRDQVMSQWESPNLTDASAVNPIVEIHVDKDGRVPPESVRLTRSSGNETYDDSAVAAARGLGYLHEPLPDGCPPDIPITFKLTR